MPPDPPQPGAFARFPLDLLGRAVAIYLATAYPGLEPPPAVRRRLAWDVADGPEVLLNAPPFERVGQALDGSPIVGLRLGNARYPHMKMQVQPWDGPDRFLFSVNTHDHALSIGPDSADAEAFARLQAENQALKVAIESAWDDAGVPTFTRYLRNYLAVQSAGSRGSGGTLA